PPGDRDVISQVDRLSSNETKIARRSVWIAGGASARSATTCMVVSRVGGLATSLWQSAGRYPDAHGIFRATGITGWANRERRISTPLGQLPILSSWSAKR